MARLLVASIAGGLIVFIWGFVSHEILSIGSMGMHMDKLPGEAEIRSTLADHVPESGLYYVPGMDASISDVAASQTEWMERVSSGPVAFLVVQKNGFDGNMAVLMGAEFATSAVAALVASLILAGLRCSYLCRVAVVGSLGLFAWFSYGASEVIWYGFPNEFGLGGLLDQVIGWTLAGIVMAAIVRPRRAPASA